jgi:hypothetical protein
VTSNYLALLTPIEKIIMPQAVRIETQSKQQGLAHVHSQRATWCTRRELALDRREQALDQDSTPVNPSWVWPPHLGADSMNPPDFLSALGGDHAQCPELLPDVSVIPFAVELCVGQYRPDARFSEVASTTAGKFAQSLHRPLRAICDNRNC